MRDLTDPKYMVLKAILFAFIVLLSAFLLWYQNQSFQTVILTGLCVWAACRIYYFLFYVTEKYIDPTFKFAGLFSVVQYLLRRKRQEDGAPSRER